MNDVVVEWTYLVPRRLGGQRVLSRQYGATNENADEYEVTPVRVRTKLETKHSESVHANISPTNLMK